MGLNIKAAIKKHGLTVYEVADKMGINRVTLSIHINGNPSLRVLSRIADAIGCDISELFDKKENNYTSNCIMLEVVCPCCGKTIKISFESV